MPLYAVYTLLFSGSGLDTSQISVLLVIWSATAVVLEVPSGALADRFSPRAALVAGGVLRAAGYALWIMAPGFAGFAAGFVLWGASGSLESGSFQSLLYSGLDRYGAAETYTQVLGRTEALARVAEVGATLAAAPLLVLGGTTLVGWVSVGVCLIGSAVAVGFPGPEIAASAPGGAPIGEKGEDEPRYVELLRSGVREAWGHPRVRRLVIVLAVVYGCTAVDEYVPLLARAASVPKAWIPVVLASLPLAAAAGNALSGAASRADRRRWACRWWRRPPCSPSPPRPVARRCSRCSAAGGSWSTWRRCWPTPACRTPCPARPGRRSPRSPPWAPNWRPSPCSWSSPH